MPDKKYTYLALGDSYTIGEGVPENDNFPQQVVQLIKRAGYSFHSPVIIAKTGWTTTDLLEGLEKAPILPEFDFVSLLIGVNNQYQGRTHSEYEKQFEELVKKAIEFAGSKANQVAVFSIPDWGVTPFAQGRNRVQIASEIDVFNSINKIIALNHKVNYFDITTGAREAAMDETMLTDDKLHPSGKEYQRWAQRWADRISYELKSQGG